MVFFGDVDTSFKIDSKDYDGSGGSLNPWWVQSRKKGFLG